MYVYVIVLLLLLAVLVHYALKLKKILYPTRKAYKQYEPTSSSLEDGIKTRFSEKNIPSNLDAIVIGSGMGGLGVAAFLSKYGGKKVLVLEQHDVIGGCLHSFKDKGFEFDTGLHYVGQMSEKGKMSSSKALMDIVTEFQVKWEKMDDVYDEVVLGDKRYHMSAGRSQFRQSLLSHFPTLSADIDTYLKLVDAVRPAKNDYYMLKLLPDWLAKLLSPIFARKFYSFSDKTVQQVMSDVTKDKELAGVLTYAYGDYGTSPDVASFAIQAMVANHYLEGAFYPIGGSLEICKHACRLIEKSGGKSLVSARVTEVILRKGKACGVRVAKGSKIIEIMAPTIISNAGAIATFKRLVPKNVQSAFGLPKLLDNVQPNVGHICLFVGMNKSAKDLKLTSRNLWLMPSTDHVANQQKYYEDKTTFNLVFLSFPSTKDPTWDSKFPNKSTCSIIAEAPFGWFEKYQIEWHKKKRNEPSEYEELKARFTKLLMAKLFEACSTITEGCIAYKELGTPLTNNYYLGRMCGESYGLHCTPKRFRQSWLKPQTPIPNLYLTGQDVVCCGVTGALGGGLYTAMSVLGCNLEGFIKEDCEARKKQE